jgi:NAD(P)-dependent dehydrogenase (short-subunit alcohol dehydrogenase family)
MARPTRKRPRAASRRPVCLLTGAGGRLGQVFCTRYAGELDIAAVYRRTLPALASQKQHAIDPLTGKRPAAAHAVFAVQADLTLEADLARVVDVVLARFGAVDVLVNAAGHALWGSLINSDQVVNAIEEQFAINTFAPVRLARELALRFWRTRDRDNRSANRSVVSVSSIAGIYVYPGQGQSVYGASKAALNCLSCHMAEEFAAFGVRVNALAPNSFPHLVPTERVADAIVRLAHGAMTGKILVMDTEEETLV